MLICWSISNVSSVAMVDTFTVLRCCSVDAFGADQYHQAGSVYTVTVKAPFRVFHAIVYV
jgi:hypothetical protein